MRLRCYFILPLLMFFLTRATILTTILIKEKFCCFINLAIIGTSSFVLQAIHINLMTVHRYSHGKWSWWSQESRTQIVTTTTWKVSKYGVFSAPYFQNTEKYGTEKTLYLDTFHTMRHCTAAYSLQLIFLN